MGNRAKNPDLLILSVEGKIIIEQKHGHQSSSHSFKDKDFRN